MSDFAQMTLIGSHPAGGSARGGRSGSRAVRGAGPAEGRGVLAPVGGERGVASPANAAAIPSATSALFGGEQDLVRVAWEIVKGGALARISPAEADLVQSCEASAADGGGGVADAARGILAGGGAGETADAVGGDDAEVAGSAGVGGADEIAELVGLIRAGDDPLGDAFIRLRPREQRRLLGATYTPEGIVSAMVGWAAGRARPARVVDPGAGSARFLLAAGRVFGDAVLVGVELDPLAALLARANLTAAGLDNRSRVTVADYRTADIGETAGVTAFIGNPPYVRHHDIAAEWKQWLHASSTRLGLKGSGLAGLHVHFLVATALHARRGDIGAFVTSAEWLDVNYGRLPRNLVAARLGGVSVHIIDPEATPFDGAATTAAVMCFEVGSAVGAVRIKRVGSAAGLGSLDGGRPFPRKLLRDAPRWSALLDDFPEPPAGYVELGELCRVHRGAVTGANAIWIIDPDDASLPPSVLFPCVTRAKELFDIRGGVLTDTGALRAAVGLPAELDELDDDERAQVEEFLRAAERRGVPSGYVARHRRPWWSVRLRDPAPILATYMARRPPTFVRNPAGARNINVAHGIYPRDPMTAAVLDALAAALRDAAATAVGRTYAGGLVKFEPSEMARIRVPGPELLQGTADA